MKTKIQYTKEIDVEEEINPIKVKIRCHSIEFTFEDGTKKTSVCQGGNTYAIIEDGELRFNKPLIF